MKEYHISIFEEKEGLFLTKDIERRGSDYITEDPFNAWKKRYILDIGDRVVDIFGNIVTIKEILHHEETKSTNFLVEENENCYCPWEFAGLFMGYIHEDNASDLIIGIQIDKGLLTL